MDRHVGAGANRGGGLLKFASLRDVLLASSVGSVIAVLGLGLWVWY